MRLTKGFMAVFAPAKSLPSPATLLRLRMLTSYICLIRGFIYQDCQKEIQVYHFSTKITRFLSK